MRRTRTKHLPEKGVSDRKARRGRGSSGGRAALVAPAPRGAPCSASPTQRGAAPEVPCPSAYKPCHVGFQRGAPLLPGTPGAGPGRGLRAGWRPRPGFERCLSTRVPPLAHAYLVQPPLGQPGLKAESRIPGQRCGPQGTGPPGRAPPCRRDVILNADLARLAVSNGICLSVSSFPQTRCDSCNFGGGDFGAVCHFAVPYCFWIVCLFSDVNSAAPADEPNSSSENLRLLSPTSSAWMCSLL